MNCNAQQYWQANEENWFDVKCRWGKGIDVFVIDVSCDDTLKFRVYAQERIVFDAVLKGKDDV